jgi:hypothetical protein
LTGLGLWGCAAGLAAVVYLQVAHTLEGTRTLHGDTPIVLDLAGEEVVYIFEVTQPLEPVPYANPSCEARFLETGFTPSIRPSTREPIRLRRESTYTPLLEFDAPYSGKYSMQCTSTPVKLAAGAVPSRSASQYSTAAFWVVLLAVGGAACVISGRRRGRRFDRGEEPPAQVPLPPAPRT